MNVCENSELLMSKREKIIKVELNEAACKELSMLCGQNGLTISQLIENFIGDLTGINSNGSDERMAINDWFDRCNFLAEESLLSNLLQRGYMEEFIDILDVIKTAKQDIADSTEHPEKYNKEEITLLNDDLANFQEQYEEIVGDWIKEHPKANIANEIETIRKWHQESIDFQNE